MANSIELRWEARGLLTPCHPAAFRTVFRRRMVADKGSSELFPNSPAVSLLVNGSAWQLVGLSCLDEYNTAFFPA